jgi:hypothetical protein
MALFARFGQPPLHHVDRDEEVRGDLLVGQALPTQCQECPELIVRIQRRALGDLGERACLGDAALANYAWDGRGLGEAPTAM